MAYTWRADYAGQALRCSCGKVIVLPAALPEAQTVLEPIADGQLPDQSLLRVCAACGGLLVPDTVVCLDCGYDTTTGSLHTTTVEHELTWWESIKARYRAAGVAAFKDREIPIAILAVGLILNFAFKGFKSEDHIPPVWLLLFCVQIVIHVTIMFLVCLIVRWLTGGGFGTLWMWLIKLAAIYVTLAAFGIVMGPLPFFVALWGMWAIKLPLYYIMLRGLFDIESFEAFFTTMVIFGAEFCCLLRSGLWGMY